jgi:hypothetical protein
VKVPFSLCTLLWRVLQYKRTQLALVPWHFYPLRHKLPEHYLLGKRLLLVCHLPYCLLFEVGAIGVRSKWWILFTLILFSWAEPKNFSPRRRRGEREKEKEELEKGREIRHTFPHREMGHYPLSFDYGGSKRSEPRSSGAPERVCGKRDQGTRLHVFPNTCRCTHVNVTCTE